MKKINYLLKQYINENLYTIIILLAMFLIGTIGGIFYANSLSNEMKIQLLEYIKDTNTSVLKGQYVLDNMSIIYSTIKNSLVYVLIVYILGCSVVLSPLIYGVFIYKGFSIGFCTSILIMLLGNVKGSIYSIISLFLPSIIFMFFLIFLSVIWIKFGKNILHNKSLYNFKVKIYGNSVITAITLILLSSFMIPTQIIINNILYKFIKII